jgi:hypothetical protein
MRIADRDPRSSILDPQGGFYGATKFFRRLNQISELHFDNRSRRSGAEFWGAQ